LSPFENGNSLTPPQEKDKENLMLMGFDADRVEKAILSLPNSTNEERIEWIFSNNQLEAEKDVRSGEEVKEQEKKGPRYREIPYQLQRLFAKLQSGNSTAFSTRKLTESFGWNSNDTHIQHDVLYLFFFSSIPF